MHRQSYPHRRSLYKAKLIITVLYHSFFVDGKLYMLMVALRKDDMNLGKI